MKNIFMTDEKWKDVIGYEGLYQVSNLGRVKSLKNGNERILKPRINSKGYYNVGLSKHKEITKTIHRLVYEAFNGIITDSRHVDHINHIRTDNRIENLQLLTNRENTTKGYLRLKKSELPVGVTKHSNSFLARIRIGKKRHTKTFPTIEQASNWYYEQLKTFKNE